MHSGTIYLAGQVPNDATQDVRRRTGQVLHMVERLLARIDSHKTNILMVQIFLDDPDCTV